jgi:hypothetical protein
MSVLEKAIERQLRDIRIGLDQLNNLKDDLDRVGLCELARTIGHKSWGIKHAVDELDCLLDGVFPGDWNDRKN